MANFLTPYYKFGVIIFVEAILLVTGIVTVLFAFDTFGLIIAAIAFALFSAAIIGTASWFGTKGIDRFSFEEAIVHTGKVFPKQVLIKDPEFGTEWFNETGRLVHTQRGDFFYYTFFPLFGHKKLVINALTNEQVAANPIEIHSKTAPRIYNDCLWLTTENAIIVKGKQNDYLELKEYESALGMTQNIGGLMREAIAGNPKLKEHIANTVTLTDLMDNNI